MQSQRCGTRTHRFVSTSNIRPVSSFRWAKTKVGKTSVTVNEFIVCDVRQDDAHAIPPATQDERRCLRPFAEPQLAGLSNWL
eukprot:COSAG02_NODE_181_length_30783_cov_53.060520_25_plen_82_part_00